jgi:hypothetical protein
MFVGAQPERVPWRGVAREGQVGEQRGEYRRRQPEGTVLYEAVSDNLDFDLRGRVWHPRSSTF